ncbi:hypothetical protein [Amycolatopsis sp. NPDC051371]|uniref:hypothetical protein n=1 Tax=Amycolatopsis sp. NPDC051371 TaxID=3155800 RepID=UPI003444F9CF
MWTRFSDLLVGRGQEVSDDLPGAELVVFGEGREVFRAALARHARRDLDDPAVVWIRPLVTSATIQSGLPAFDIAVVRRRALHVARAEIDDRFLALDLVSGQQARIEPARAERLGVLQDFDTWLTTLSGDQRAEMAALDHD